LPKTRFGESAAPAVKRIRPASGTLIMLPVVRILDVRRRAAPGVPYSPVSAFFCTAYQIF
jgi:hypothetical protein